MTESEDSPSTYSNDIILFFSSGEVLDSSESESLQCHEKLSSSNHKDSDYEKSTSEPYSETDIDLKKLEKSPRKLTYPCSVKEITVFTIDELLKHYTMTWERKFPILNLINELQMVIVHFLSFDDARNLAITCKHMKDLVIFCQIWRKKTPEHIQTWRIDVLGCRTERMIFKVGEFQPIGNLRDRFAEVFKDFLPSLECACSVRCEDLPEHLKRLYYKNLVFLNLNGFDYIWNIKLAPLTRDAIVNFLQRSRSRSLTFCSLLENLPKDIRFVEKRRPQSSKKVLLPYYFISEQEIQKLCSKLDPKLQKQEVKKPKLDAPNLERKRKCPEYRPVCLGKGEETKKQHFEFELNEREKELCL